MRRNKLLLHRKNRERRGARARQKFAASAAPADAAKRERLRRIILNDKKRASILSGVVNDFDTSKKLSYSSNIKISNEISNLILKDDGFIWPEIDLIYIEKYLNYLQEIKFINYKE